MGRVLHASLSGYFPFCIIEATSPSSVGAGTSYPVGMTLENAMRLYWIVKRYKITTPGGTAFSYSDFLPFSMSPPEREEDLICPLFSGRTKYGFVSNSTPDELIDQAGIEIFNNNPAIIKYENLYYPFLYVVSQYRVIVNFEITQYCFLYSTEVGSFHTTFTIPGIGEVPMYLLPPSTSPAPIVDVYATFEIEDYWSYDGLYSTSTGQPITLT